MKEVFGLPPGHVLRKMDLGWHTLAADLLFIRANIYYGQHIFGDEELPWLSSFVDVLLELDPDFKAAYLWAALVTKFQKRDSSRLPPSAVRSSIEILKRGYERFPGDYRFPMQIAFNLYYELGRIDEALPYFRRASELPAAPRWLKAKLVDLLNKKGKRRMARLILEHLIATTENEVLAKGMRDRLLALMRAKESKRLDARRKAMLREWKDDFPYIPLDLYLVISPEPGPLPAGDD